VTDSNQSVTGTLTTEGFGQTVATTGSSTNPYMFAATSGYRNDGDAGLMHVGARYYDAQVGRFITRDTYLSQHPYVYCNADPVNAVDPAGHMPGWLRKAIDIGEDIIIGGAVAVGATILLPVEAPAIVVIGVGALAGTLIGGATAANDYYWDHPDIDLWDPGDFNWGIGRGAIVGGVGGAITGPPLIGWLKPIVSPPAPVIDPLTQTFVGRLVGGGTLR
jgi:RHS repeat-associated protein